MEKEKIFECYEFGQLKPCAQLIADLFNPDQIGNNHIYCHLGNVFTIAGETMRTIKIIYPEEIRNYIFLQIFGVIQRFYKNKSRKEKRKKHLKLVRNNIIEDDKDFCPSICLPCISGAISKKN